MEKQMINLEYPLATKSPSIVWGLISNAAGLQKWLADYVEEEGDKMVFSWGEEWTEQDKKSATDYMQWSPCSEAQCIPIECSGFHAACLNAVYSMQREEMEPY